MSKTNQSCFFVFLGLLLAFPILFACHTWILRPLEVLTVDYRRLSDAKLGQLTERAMAGQRATVDELEQFIEALHSVIRAKAQGRPVFTAGTVFNADHDLTEEIAQDMGLDLSKSLEMSLPGLARRVETQVSRNMRPLTGTTPAKR